MMHWSKSTYLIDTKVGIGRNDGSAGEVDTLSTEITSETTLLSLEPLAESSHRLLTLQSSEEDVSTKSEKADPGSLRAPSAFQEAPS